MEKMRSVCFHSASTALRKGLEGLSLFFFSLFIRCSTHTTQGRVFPSVRSSWSWTWCLSKLSREWYGWRHGTGSNVLWQGRTHVASAHTWCLNPPLGFRSGLKSASRNSHALSTSKASSSSLPSSYSTSSLSSYCASPSLISSGTALLLPLFTSPASASSCRCCCCRRSTRDGIVSITWDCRFIGTKSRRKSRRLRGCSADGNSPLCSFPI
mmetsp:Transcript_48600/g.82965  ORF Transcript_48600/g.82965 Transcript_48600/m.82965 type:complete len:211 (-) Transcript_48600:55-687(-)